MSEYIYIDICHIYFRMVCQKRCPPSRPSHAIPASAAMWEMERPGMRTKHQIMPAEAAWRCHRMPWKSQDMGIMVIWGTCIRVIWLIVNKWLVMMVMVNHYGNFNHELVGWWTLPLWKMMEFVSWDDDIPNWMEKHSQLNGKIKFMFQITNQLSALGSLRCLNYLKTWVVLCKVQRVGNDDPSANGPKWSKMLVPTWKMREFWWRSALHGPIAMGVGGWAV